MHNHCEMSLTCSFCSIDNFLNSTPAEFPVTSPPPKAMLKTHQIHPCLVGKASFLRTKFGQLHWCVLNAHWVGNKKRQIKWNWNPLKIFLFFQGKHIAGGRPWRTETYQMWQLWWCKTRWNTQQSIQVREKINDVITVLPVFRLVWTEMWINLMFLSPLFLVKESPSWKGLLYLLSIALSIKDSYYSAYVRYVITKLFFLPSEKPRIPQSA